MFSSAETEKILRAFPKRRPELPSDYQKIYEEAYKRNRQGESVATTAAQKLEQWLHHKVAQDGGGASTLDLGAGTLNHLPYETTTRDYDIVEPFEALYQSSPYLSRIRRIYADIFHIPNDVVYDRIISIATFEHLCELPTVTAQCGLLLSSEGTLRVAIPSEGTLLWTLGWKLTTGLEFKLKYGLDYGTLMRHEHVNTAKEIETVLNYFFKRVSGSVFGISKSLSFYQFYECALPNVNQCREYLLKSQKVSVV